MTIFAGAARIEGVHPLQFGFVRRKVRTQRRHGMPLVNPLVFYPWRAFDVASAASAVVQAVPALSRHHEAREGRSGGEGTIWTRR